MLYLLNGPPRSGKDTAGAMMASCLGRDGYSVAKLAAELKERTHAAYRLFGTNSRPLRHDWFESVKDEPREEFLGRTPRDAYIQFHEGMLKPLHGEEVLGVLLLARLRGRLFGLDPEGDLIVTDAGDRLQCLPLVDAFGEANTTLIHLEAQGSRWTDNRVPFTLDRVRTVEVTNPKDSCSNLLRVLKDTLPELRRKDSSESPSSPATNGGASPASG